MILSHKIRLDPTKSQAEYFTRAAGTARFVYNWALSNWTIQYKAGLRPNVNSLKKLFNMIYHDQYAWIEDVHRDCHSQPFANLQSAFNSFFKGINKYPKFKKKGSCQDKFYVANDKIQFDEFMVRIPIIGWVKIREKLRFDGKIMGASVKRVANKWFISVQVEVGEYHQPRTGTDTIGIDLGLKTFATLSNGTKIESPRPLKRMLSKLKRESRKLSRRKRGGKNRARQAQVLTKLHSRIADQRNDFLNKITTQLCRKNQTVIIEDLAVDNMQRNHHLAQAINDSSWGEFRRMLEYKALIYRTELIIADRWFPSSKKCSCCDNIKNDLKLSERMYSCEKCGVEVDRDLNAAINLSRLGSSRSHAHGQDRAVGRLVEVRTYQLTSVN